eukprot:GFUD01038515.1.p1 GENE.GFUD01038515.1~~GFUD01038515.1.p1  ORF type:complete len:597 (+),score=185.24 GFUD01038515.1:22-1812(+)
MSKLIIVFVLSFICVAFGGAAEKQSKLQSETKENSEVNHLLVKREAKKREGNGKKNGGTRKKKGKNGKKGKKARKENKKKSPKKGRGKKSGKKSTNNRRKTKKKSSRKKKKGKGGKIKNTRKGGRKSGKKSSGNGKSGSEKEPKKSGKKIKKVKKVNKNNRNKGTKRSKKGKGISKPVSRQSVNYTTCVAKFIEYSRINELKARSVEQQVNRINSFKGIQEKKVGKKGDFQGTYNTLLSALGGNDSAPECDGDSKSSLNSKYKDTLSQLKSCESDIQTACNYQINSTENATLAACLAAAKKFKAEFKTCFSAKLSTADACTCVETGIDTANYDVLKKCDTKAKSDDIKAKKKACIKGFIKCKTAQDDSVDGVGSCKKVNRCGGVPNKTEAARILKILTPLKDALNNGKFEAALKKLGLDTGDGAGGSLPANKTRLSQLRMARSVEKRQSSGDGTGCTEIDAEWGNFNTSGSKAVASVDGDVDEKETNNTIDSLDKLNNRATLEDDLNSCAKEGSRQVVTVTFTIVRIRFFVFWCGWFRVFVVEIKITIITISFGLPPAPTPPSPPTVAPSPVPTAAPGGGRQIMKQILKRAAFSKK